MFNLKLFTIKAVATISILTASNLALSAPTTWYDTIAGGTSTFNNMVTGAGGSVSSYHLDNLTSASLWDFGDFSIESTNGNVRGISSASSDNSTGDMISISDTFTNPEQSGITFTFDNAINSIGFEVGDWATCCMPSSLYISLGGGPTQLIATATSALDNPSYAAGGSFGESIFVGAIDTSTTFTSITFYGDSTGEFLTAGGTVLFANIAAVPEPETYAMLISGLGLLGFVRRRKSKAI